MTKIEDKNGYTYELNEVIAQGSFGRVYKSNYRYAVK